MATGIRHYSLYFLDPPTPAQVVAGLHALTGLSIGVVAQPEGCLELFHPDKPAWRIEVAWSTDRVAKLQGLLAAVPELTTPPFPYHPHSISLSLDPRPAPRSYRYLEISLLLVLQGFQGQLEDPLSLPNWAGTKWTDMPLLGRWGTIKEHWK
ncbi:MAG: hypothetical protein ACRYFR_15995 [Janthinobacterium lividum]